MLVEVNGQQVDIDPRDIICSECIRTDDPDKIAQNENNFDSNEAPVNTKIITIIKTWDDYAKHILKEHPLSSKTEWAKLQLGLIKEPIVIAPVTKTTQKPPKVNIFKRLVGKIHFQKPTIKLPTIKSKKVSP